MPRESLRGRPGERVRSGPALALRKKRLSEKGRALRKAAAFSSPHSRKQGRAMSRRNGLPSGVASVYLFCCFEFNFGAFEICFICFFVSGAFFFVVLLYCLEDMSCLIKIIDRLFLINSLNVVVDNLIGQLSTLLNGH